MKDYKVSRFMRYKFCKVNPINSFSENYVNSRNTQKLMIRVLSICRIWSTNLFSMNPPPLMTQKIAMTQPRRKIERKIQKKEGSVGRQLVKQESRQNLKFVLI